MASRSVSGTGVASTASRCQRALRAPNAIFDRRERTPYTALVVLDLLVLTVRKGLRAHGQVRRVRILLEHVRPRLGLGEGL